MKARTLLCAAACAAVLALAGCGEKSQDLGTSAKLDAPPYDGTGVASFTAPGWKAGGQQLDAGIAHARPVRPKRVHAHPEHHGE